MARPTHRHDLFHRGQVPTDQLADGTATDTYVPTSNGDGTVTWAAGGGGGGGSFTPVVISAEMNSGNEPTGNSRVPWDTFYDVDGVDLLGVLPAGVGLTYNSGNQSFEADEDGVWVVSIGLDLIVAPGATGDLSLSIPTFGYGPIIHVAASGNATEWVTERTFQMRTGDAFFLVQSASSTALINGYAVLDIIRTADSVA